MSPVRSFCCPLHASVGFGFPIGTAGPDGPMPSFSDQTNPEVSAHCIDTLGAAEDFVEQMAPDQEIIITNVTVIAMTDGADYQHQRDVSIRNGRIEAIRPTGEKPPSAATIIDGTDQYLIPGLADMHLHMVTRHWAAALADRLEQTINPDAYALPIGLSLFQCLAAGVTRIEIMAGDPDMLRARDEVASGRIAGPRVRVGSPLIDGPQPIQSPKMSWLCSDAEGGRIAAGLIAERGYDFAKPYSNLPADAYHALVEECRTRDIPVIGHVPLRIGLDDALGSGNQDIAHAAEFFYWLDDPERTDPDRISRHARLIAMSGRWVQLTVCVGVRLERIIIEGAVKEDFEDIAFCNPLVLRAIEFTEDKVNQFKAEPQMMKLIRGARSTTADVVRALSDAGANMVTGTDACNPYLVDGFSVHEELETLVAECGLSPKQALATATKNAGAYWGEAGVSGVISEGAYAELVLLSRDPLENIRATRDIAHVFARTHHISGEAITQGKQHIVDTFAAMASLA